MILNAKILTFNAKTLTNDGLSSLGRSKQKNCSARIWHKSGTNLAQIWHKSGTNESGTNLAFRLPWWFSQFFCSVSNEFQALSSNFKREPFRFQLALLVHSDRFAPFCAVFVGNWFSRKLIVWPRVYALQ